MSFYLFIGFILLIFAILSSLQRDMIFFGLTALLLPIGILFIFTAGREHGKGYPACESELKKNTLYTVKSVFERNRMYETKLSTSKASVREFSLSKRLEIGKDYRLEETVKNGERQLTLVPL